MSISPQSLARTRDKRSLRLPARFDDMNFEVAPELTYRNVAEALRLKAKNYKNPSEATAAAAAAASDSPRALPPELRSSTLRQSSNNRKETPETSDDSANTTATDTSGSSNETLRSHLTESPPQKTLPGAGKTSTSTATATKSNTTASNIATAVNANQSATTATTTTSSSSSSSSTLKPPIINTYSKSSNLVTQNTSSNTDAKKSLAGESCNVSEILNNSSITSETVKAHLLDAEKKNSSQKRDKEDGNDNQDEGHVKIRKISPFYPEIRMVRASQLRWNPETKSYECVSPLREPNSPTTQTGQSSPTHPPKTTLPSALSTSSAAKKKSKGFSLMVKSNSNGTQIQTPTMTTNGVTNGVPSQTKPAGPPQQPKLYNNLTPNMHYGTRLMLNEPIYLPRSVSTIAPITSTLQQIVAQAKRPPFISKRAEAFIAYQDEHKMNNLLSSHMALVRITRYLGVKDRMNLRCVNKAWKSIIDSDLVWERLLLTERDNDIFNWEDNLASKRYSRTTEVILDEHVSSECVDMCSLMLRQIPNLKRVWIRSVEAKQNEFANDLLLNMAHAKCQKHLDNQAQEEESKHEVKGSKRTVRLHWRVKVGVDDRGIAKVLFPVPDRHSEVYERELYGLEKEMLRFHKIGGPKNRMLDFKFDIRPI